jgi:hypothetical protein
MKNSILTQKKTAIKSIREYCLDYCGGSPSEVKGCTANITTEFFPIPCPLYPFRLGRNPNKKKRILTEEERTVLRERMTLARKTKAPQSP